MYWLVSHQSVGYFILFIFVYFAEGFLEMPNNNDWSQLQICFLKKTNDSGKIVTYPKSVAWHIKEVGVTFAEVLLNFQIKLLLNFISISFYIIYFTNR